MSLDEHLLDQEMDPGPEPGPQDSVHWADIDTDLSGSLAGCGACSWHGPERRALLHEAFSDFDQHLQDVEWDAWADAEIGTLEAARSPMTFGERRAVAVGVGAVGSCVIAMMASAPGWEQWVALWGGAIVGWAWSTLHRKAG